MIWHLARKDWRLLWPMVLLVTAVQAALEWTIHRSGALEEDAAVKALLHPLTLAWYVAIGALATMVVHQDPLAGVDQDWLVRPLRRSHLLAAKLLFVAAIVCIPMLALNLTDALGSGAAIGDAVREVLLKETFVFLCWVVPVMSLASLTRSMSELIGLASALMVAFAAGVSIWVFARGADWCPTCNSGVSWLEHLLQHAAVLGGALLLLWLQYYRRRTALARILAVCGTLLFVALQLPWDWAFALQQRLGPGSEATAPVQLAFAQTLGRASGLAPAAATIDVPRGMGPALQYVRRRALARGQPVAVEVPLRLSGTTPADILLADRTEIRLLDSSQHAFFRTTTAGNLASILSAPGARSSGGAIAQQYLVLPGAALDAATHAAQAQFNYSLSLMRIHSVYRLPALNGSLEAGAMGHCSTSNDRKTIYLRCKTIVEPPFCYSAQLVAESQSDPQVLKCTPDYRRHMPAFTEVLRFYGIDLPMQDRVGTSYPIDATHLARATVIFTIFSERAHFLRSLTVEASALRAWRVAGR